jgi:hypothetical protein
MSVEHDISVTSAAIAHHARVSSAIEQQHIGFSVRSSHAEMVDPAVKGHDNVEPVGIRRGRDVHARISWLTTFSAAPS